MPALSFSLILVSIRKTSKSQLETGKQPPESCPAQHGVNVSDIGDNPAFFLAKKLNGNGACGWSSWSSQSMTQHFVVMHKRHVHVQLWRRAKQRNGKRIRHRETRDRNLPNLSMSVDSERQCQQRGKGGGGKKGRAHQWGAGASASPRWLGRQQSLAAAVAICQRLLAKRA